MAQADLRRSGSLRAGSEVVYSKLAPEGGAQQDGVADVADSSGLAQDYMYHLGVASDDSRLDLFRVGLHTNVQIGNKLFNVRLPALCVCARVSCPPSSITSRLPTVPTQTW